VKTPLGYIADRFTLGPRSLRWATTSALVVSILIVFTGGLVRVTGSGLGCPTWPTCEGTSIAPSADLGIHGLIEFANRAFTTVIILTVAWVIVAARLQKPVARWTTRLAWSQFWLVVANAVAGGITVLVKLNPWVVALHFVLAMALLATTTITWHRVREKPTTVVLTPLGRQIGWVLIAVTALLILVGTLVSGTGPHSGDSAEVPRISLDWATVTRIHGLIGVLVLALAVLLLVVERGNRLVRTRVITLIAVVIVQAVIGVTQALSGLPEALVAVHLLGAALVWVGALRVLLDLNPRTP
jgi:heme a synthase